jgi:WD40 repeat protein
MTLTTSVRSLLRYRPSGPAAPTQQPIAVLALFSALLSLIAPARADVLVSSWEGKIQRYREGTNTLLGDFATGLDSNHGLAYGPDGRVYVTEYTSKRIRRFNADGTGATILVPSIPETPFDLTLDSAGNLYVTTGGSVLYKYGPDGSARGTIGSGWLSGAVQAAIGPDGYVYVCNNGFQNVVRMRPDGSDPGVVVSAAPDAFGLDIAANGDLYISSPANNMIYRWRSSVGRTDFASVPRPYGMHFDTNGDLLCGTADYQAQFYRIRQDGTFDTVNTGMLVAPSVTSPSHRAPSAVFVGGENNFIRAYDTRGNDLGYFVQPGAGGLDAWVQDMVFGPDGNLYVAAYGNSAVKKYDGNTGSFLGDVVSGYPSPLSVTFDSNSNIFVGGPNKVSKYSYGGTLLAEWAIPGYSYGIAFHSDGRLLIASPNGPDVGTVTALNVVTGAKSTFATGLGDPVAINRGPDGRYYVTNGNSGLNPDMVYAIPPNGGAASIFAAPGSSGARAHSLQMADSLLLLRITSGWASARRLLGRFSGTSRRFFVQPASRRRRRPAAPPLSGSIR